MKIFKNKKEGGLADVIRCDEKDYLVWKWTPSGLKNTTQKENAIRYGSSLRVKDGEMAVFFYKQNNGKIHDYIIGPFDGFIKTENFPILSSFVSLGWDGKSPFQAEIYFINLAGIVQIKFGTPTFDIFDPRFQDLGINCNVRGTLTFQLIDYQNFIKLNRLQEFELDDFRNQIRDFCIQKIKSVVTNIPSESNIAVLQIERQIDIVSDVVKEKIKNIIEDEFGVKLKRIDFSAIELDQEHENYKQLKRITIDQASKKIEAVTDVEIENISEMARIQRKDAELGVEGKNFTVHQLNRQAEVLKTAAENLGQASNVNLGDGGGINPAGMMFGLGVGGAMGGQVGGMMSNLSNTPPPSPQNIYHISFNGIQSGPHTLEQLKELALNEKFSKKHYVWKPGMSGWEVAEKVSELIYIFDQIPPPPPA